MDLIVETDCGHDPDDFFTLCYLVAAGVSLRCIAVTPGDRDQLAVVRLFCEQVGLDIPIGHSKASDKYSSGSVRHALLERYRKSRHGQSDGPGKDLMRDTLRRYPGSEVFIIGPPSSVGRFLTDTPEMSPFGGRRCTIRGGDGAVAGPARGEEVPRALPPKPRRLCC